MDGLYAVNLLRAEAGLAPNTRIEIEHHLPRLHPVAIVQVDGLTIRRMEAWLESRRIQPSDPLARCTDRRLRGGVAANGGRALLFVDESDAPRERNYTVAHEAAHFLADHLYPRREAATQLGTGILEVLDGLRAPTTEERVHALLRRTELSWMTHMLARDDAGMNDSAHSEIEADRFACEALAPHLLVESSIEEGVTDIRALLEDRFALPARIAKGYAHGFTRHATGPELLSRLQIL